MRLRILLALIVFLLVLACVRVEDQVIPDYLSPEKDDFQEEKSSIVSTSGSSQMFIKSVICDSKGFLKFTLVNPYAQVFALKTMPTFEAEALGIYPTRITINGRNLEGLEKFCTKDVLEKGDVIVCEKHFEPNSKIEKVMIRTQTEPNLPVPKNSLRFTAPGFGYEAVFTCE